MRTTIPVKLMLILILVCAINFGLILGIQSMFSYRAAGHVDEAALARLDKQYDGCTIVSDQEITSENLYIFLVEKSDGSLHFVTLRKHFLMKRYQLLKGGCLHWSGGEEETTLKAGFTKLQVSVREHSPTGVHMLRVDSLSYGQSDIQKTQMLLSILGLCAAELAVWCLVFRKEEIA